MTPIAARLDHDSVGVNPVHDAARDYRLQLLGKDVGERSSYQPVQVADLDAVGVDEHEVADADVSKLLGNVRSATTEADDPDRQRSKQVVALGTEEALPGSVLTHNGLRSGAWGYRRLCGA